MQMFFSNNPYSKGTSMSLSTRQGKARSRFISATTRAAKEVFESEQTRKSIKIHAKSFVNSSVEYPTLSLHP